MQIRSVLIIAWNVLRAAGLLAWTTVLALTGRRRRNQPYLGGDRLRQGLVIVLPGIEGRSPFNEQIAHGLIRGGVPCAINLWDWTGSWFWFLNLGRRTKNIEQATEIASYVSRYLQDYPGRPVYIVGQSGGCGVAAWAAERLRGTKITGIVMLASALSPTYPLDKALNATQEGIVSFYSRRDLVMLGLGTTLFGAMDGPRGSAAGRMCFRTPTDPQLQECYGRLHQVPWKPEMAATGHLGMHLTSSATAYVAKYVAPLILSPHWSGGLLEAISA